jgi:hypothetical protein
MDPKELLNDPQKIKDIISVLQALLPKEDVSSDSNTEKPKKTTKVKRTKKQKESEQPQSKNKFLAMQEMYMFKDDTAIDKKLSKNPPIPRTRHFDPITVKCRVCGRSEQVNPGLVYDPSRYKCNNCSSTQG